MKCQYRSYLPLNVPLPSFPFCLFPLAHTNAHAQTHMSFSYISQTMSPPQSHTLSPNPLSFPHSASFSTLLFSLHLSTLSEFQPLSFHRSFSLVCKCPSVSVLSISLFLSPLILFPLCLLTLTSLYITLSFPYCLSVF